ncbi:MAG: arylsulfatase [Chloroflexota bacterium]
MKIGFFHTSPVHISTFDNLLVNTNLPVEPIHIVDEDLLSNAVSKGIDQSIQDQVEEHLLNLWEQKCGIIVCTCSTLGAIAEQISFEGSMVVRVDRPMAAMSVAQSHVILMVAVLSSTLIPTRELILDEAKRQGKPVRIQELVIPKAWEDFLSNDLDAYHTRIAHEISSFIQDSGRCSAELVPETILLAQASMAGAKSYLAGIDQPVLSSPTTCIDFLKRRISIENK